MKSLFLTLACTLALTACGDCVDTVPDTLTIQGVTPVELPVLTPQPPAVEPTTVTPVTVTPEPVQVCPEVKGCPPPFRLWPLPVLLPLEPQPVCIRDDNSLVDMGDYFIDNCGATYGKVLVCPEGLELHRDQCLPNAKPMPLQPVRVI